MFSKLLNIKENIFITGTSTNIGKTFISKFICQKLNLSYWKPIESGISNNLKSDSQILSEVTKIYPSIYSLKDPLSPHLAAKNENIEIKIQEIELYYNKIKKENLIIEGAGGILVPINGKEYIVDLIKLLKCQSIIVAKDELGCINHTLMTIKILQQYNINIIGFVMNFAQKNSQNANEIEKYGKIKLIEKIPFYE